MIFSKKIIVLLIMGFVFSSSSYAVRRGPSGHVDKTSPRSNVNLTGDRTIKGLNANSNFSVTGTHGHGVQGTASSTVGAGHATGQATVSSNNGQHSATAVGNASVSGNTATGQATVNTSSGRGATMNGSVTKTDTGITGTGTATTNNGKSAMATVEGDKSGGTVNVSTEKGDKSVGYGDQSTRPNH